MTVYTDWLGPEEYAPEYIEDERLVQENAEYEAWRALQEPVEDDFEDDEWYDRGDEPWYV